jgi:hypothetical protein
MELIGKDNLSITSDFALKTPIQAGEDHEQEGAKEDDVVERGPCEQDQATGLTAFTGMDSQSLFEGMSVFAC